MRLQACSPVATIDFDEDTGSEASGVLKDPERLQLPDMIYQNTDATRTKLFAQGTQPGSL